MLELENKKLELQVAMANQANHSKEKIAQMNYDAQDEHDGGQAQHVGAGT